MNFVLNTNEDFTIQTRSGGVLTMPDVNCKLPSASYPISYTYAESGTSTDYLIADATKATITGSASKGWTMTHGGRTVCTFAAGTGTSSAAENVSNLSFNGDVSATLDFSSTAVTYVGATGAKDDLVAFAEGGGLTDSGVKASDMATKSEIQLSDVYELPLSAYPIKSGTNGSVVTNVGEATLELDSSSEHYNLYAVNGELVCAFTPIGAFIEGSKNGDVSFNGVVPSNGDVILAVASYQLGDQFDHRLATAEQGAKANTAVQPTDIPNLVHYIYNKAATDALDDKGGLHDSSSVTGGYWEGSWTYNNVNYSAIIPYDGVSGGVYTWKTTFGDNVSLFIKLYSNGNLIVNGASSMSPSAPAGINPTDSASGALMEGTYTYDNVPIRNATFRYVAQGVQLNAAPYSHFALESVPTRTIAARTKYNVGDLLGDNSKAYRCISEYTSEATPVEPSSDSDHWEEIPVLSQKQDALTVDSVPTSGSQNPISSGGVYDVLQFEKWYPDGSIKSEADLPENTADIKYGTPDTTNKTIGVLTFCDTSSGENNSALTGRVVVPPYKDVAGVRYTVTEISGGSGTYNNKQSLSELILPSTVTKIDVGGVKGCTALTSIYAPSVEHVGSHAFYSCTSLSNVYMPSVEKIETAAFEFSAPQSLSFPSLTSVGGSAFYGSSSLASVSLPMAKKIETGAFEYCGYLSYASLPSLTGISTDTFTMCTNLSHVEVPSVSSISDRAFSGCRHLSCLDFGNSLNTVPTLANVNAFGEVPSSCIVLVPDAQYDSWVSAENWSNLCFPQRLDFHRWSDWREAKKYEVAKKADYRKVQSTPATLQPSDVWVYNDIVLKPHPMEEMYWESDEIPGYTELSLFYEEGCWFLYGMDLPDWGYEFAADASATSLNFNGSKGRRNLYRYGSYSTADVVYQGESLPNPYPLRIAKKGYDHEADFEGTLYDGSEQVTIKVGNSDTAGVILLSDALTSTHDVSKGTAATPYAVKQLNDNKFDKTGGDIKGTIRVKKPTGLATSYTTITDSYIFTPASITVGGISTSLGITPTKVNVFNEALNIDADIYFPSTSGTLALTADIPDVSGLARKAAKPTEGNLAALDSEGNPTNSGKKPADFATAEQGAKAETSVQLVLDNANPSAKTAVTVGVRSTEDAADRGQASLAVGDHPKASGKNAVATGTWTQATGQDAHAEGNLSQATNYGAHAEGDNTRATGAYSHAEGTDTEASGLVAHAEGNYTTAAGTGAHSEGMFAKASGVAAHAEGSNLDKLADLLQASGASAEIVALFRKAASVAAGSFSHTEGLVSSTSQMGSHAQGFRASDGGNQFSFVWQGYSGAVPTSEQMQALLNDPMSEDAQIALGCLVTALNARDTYTSKGPGTFCINPEPDPNDADDDAASGFFIGDTSLKSRLKPLANESWKMPQYPNGEQLATAVKKIWQALGGSFEE